MTDLKLPKSGDGPRVRPRESYEVSPEMRASYEKARWRWGIHNHLMKTMGAFPQLGFTEVDYANSFIFDEGTLIDWPAPNDPSRTVKFPTAGFIDRVTKELVINTVSLLNRSRYSITHHALIGFGTLVGAFQAANQSPEDAAKRAEEMLLHLVDESGRPSFEDRKLGDKPLYDDFQVACLRFTVKARDAHAVSDEDYERLRAALTERATALVRSSLLGKQFGEAGPPPGYVDAYVDAMFVELTWNICHFSGLLNSWFTLMKMHDESGRPEHVPKGIGPDLEADVLFPNFVAAYNANVPERIKVRNNAILGATGFGR